MTTKNKIKAKFTLELLVSKGKTGIKNITTFFPVIQKRQKWRKSKLVHYIGPIGNDRAFFNKIAGYRLICSPVNLAKIFRIEHLWVIGCVLSNNSKLTNNKYTRATSCRSGVFIINFEHTSNIFVCFYCWLWANCFEKNCDIFRKISMIHFYFKKSADFFEPKTIKQSNKLVYLKY